MYLHVGIEWKLNVFSTPFFVSNHFVRIFFEKNIENLWKKIRFEPNRRLFLWYN